MIKKYDVNDELAWLKCRVLAFLDTAYFDDVLQKKKAYKNPSIELIYEVENKIVGILDIEYDTKSQIISHKKNEPTAVIWHLAVLPEYRNQGIASKLLENAITELKANNIKYIQAWTRDDKWVNQWYTNKGFNIEESYLHVFANNEECDHISKSEISNLFIYNAFLHYIGEDKDAIRAKFERVHDCNLYEMKI